MAVPQSLWLLCAYPRDRLEKPAFLYLLLRWSEFLLKPQYSELVLRHELFGPLREWFESQFGFPLRPRQFESRFVAPDMGAK